MKIYTLILVSLSFALVQQSGADDWLSFQNGGRLVLKQSAAIPKQWDAKQGIKWSVALAGYGQSSPVVSGDLVYVTSVTGKMKQQCHIQAKRVLDGAEVWTHTVDNSTPEKNTTYVSRAAPTPVCDQDGVIAFFEGGNLISISNKGEVRWELDLVKQYGAIKARHGLSSSLEQDEANVFVWVEREAMPYIIAVSKKSGKIAWKGEGLGVTSWSSPRLVPVEGQKHLVLSGIGKIVGMDPKTGKRLWEFDQISGNSTPTPVPLGNGKFLIGATTGTRQSATGKAAKSNGVIQIRQQDGKFRAEFVWQAEQATSSFGSPLAYNGKAYFVNRSGVLFCLDLETGKQIYAGRTKSSIWATPIGVGSQVYLFGKDGTTTIVDSGSEFKKIATNPLWEDENSRPRDDASESAGFGGRVLYSGVVASKVLLLRRGDRLFCVQGQ
ncbi:MAG: PQQ-binding-like beta-propeller repeat protein [Planctomycetota bacterium]|nr:PQQ-binding-like beta-propeller repeat protein [Planctomycetota bacterium]